ncbi:MAG TPA: LemA family protein [Afifellaceae bacterium]|nr:LemA family protein [Afifellaceae bacterium]
MADDGVISARQAELLQASLASGNRGEGDAGGARGKRRAGLVTWGVVAGIVFGSVALMWFAGGSGGSDGGPAAVQSVAESLNQSDGAGQMNRSILAFFVVALFVAVPAGVGLVSYNGLVAKEERVFSAWAQVESTLQRRADLVPRLVESVSRFIQHERETLQSVTEARGGPSSGLAAAIEDLAKAGAASAEVLAKDDEAIVETQDMLESLAEAQARMDRSIRTLLATAEAYPELRSSDQFLELQSQLEGTENRINVARLRFNDTAGLYNAAIRTVPGVFIAGLGDFRRKAYFQADEGADNAAELNFQ